MILVVGATGLLGLEICRRLRQRGDPVRALVRPGSDREPDLAAIGAGIAIGDLKDASAVAAMCRGAVTVVSTATCTASHRAGDTLRRVDRDGQLGLVRAAAAAGVERFVYISLSPNLPETCALVRYKREVERAVRESGMSWTVLQPGAFMEIWLGPLAGWDIGKGHARIVGSGEAPVSYVSLGDVAAFAVSAVCDDTMLGRDIPIAAPEPVSPNDAVRICEKMTGKTFKVQRLPAGPFRLGARLVRPVNERVHSLLALTAAIAEGDELDMTPVRETYAIPLTSLDDFVRRYVQG